MEKNRTALVRHLSEMPPAAVYALADKKHLFTGFDLANRRPVVSLEWSADGALTVCLVQADRTYHISLALTHDVLSSSCDCGNWSPRGCCPHLVASVATLKKAVTAAALPMLKLPKEYLEQIRSQLHLITGESLDVPPSLVESAPYSLEIRATGDNPEVAVCRQGVQVGLSDPLLPPALRQFLRLLLAPEQRDRCIEEFHARFCGKYPILYRDAGGLTPLALVEKPARRVLFCLEERDRRLLVSRCFEDGTLPEEGSTVTDFYHFAPHRGIVERVVESGGVAHFKRFAHLLHHLDQAELVLERNGFSLAAQAFNKLQLSFAQAEWSDFLDNSLLLFHGSPRAPREVVPQYRINLVEQGSNMRLVPEGVLPDGTFPLYSEAFWFFAAAGRSALPQPLRAKKRAAAIISACFALLACEGKAERDRAIRVALESPDFFKRGVKSDARLLLTQFWDEVSQTRSLLQLSGEGWLEVRLEVTRQARLLEILHSLFGADGFAEGDGPGEMVLPRESVMGELSRLRRECAAAGVALSFAGEPLQTVSWSFTVDATRSCIDWFELRPEITFEGGQVDEAELLEAVRGGGVYRRGGGMVVLDEESSRTLELLAAGGKKKVVRVPRLQILDWIVLRKNGVRVLLSPADEKIIESLTNFECIEERTPPVQLKAKLRRYQHDGFNWLAFLYEHRFGACLADDMGLGKTIQALAFLAGLKEGAIAADPAHQGPHLVVVPPSLIFNWESEIARFYPRFSVCVYRGQGRRARFDGVDLVLTSYGVIQRDIDELATQRFHVVVFDEAQAVKNLQAETTGAVRKLKATFKLVLTGTPVENHLGEFYSVIDLALPGLLGPLDAFRKGMTREGTDFVESLVRRTRPFVLRRTKDMIAGELPPKVETDIYLEMSPRQKGLYVRTVAQVKATVEEAYRLNSPGQARIIALTAILKLRQICLSTKLLLPEGRDSAPKVEFLLEQLEELFDEGHSVLVFSQFTSFLDIVQEALSQHGVPFCRLDGSTPVGRRKVLVEGFQASSTPSVFLLSLKAGGRGLNLTKASYVFHLDPWWNPAVENQASDRAHRIGQKNQVTITRLLMRHTIEEKMMELKKRKLKLYRALLEEVDGEGGVPIGKEDFDYLLS